ncbi:MAG: class I SAM-dependent methyltransferase [Candidatus Eisenbacteria bacterium]
MPVTVSSTLASRVKTTCYLCGSATPETSLNTRELAVIRCGSCGLRFSHPAPAPEALLELNLKNRACYSPPTEKRLHAAVRTMVMEANGDYPEAGITGTVVARLVPRRFTPDVIRYIPHGKILDVGFGSGKMLDWLKAHRWETWGIDFSINAVEVMSLKGHHVVTADVERDNLDLLSRGYFDVIRLSHILEHLRDPIGALKRLRPLLKPDGRIVVSIPNLESTAARILGRDCTMLNIPRHLYFFSPAVLETVLMKSGFTVTHKRGKDSPGMAMGSLGRIQRGQSRLATWRAFARLAYNWLKPRRPLESFDLITFDATVAEDQTLNMTPMQPTGEH